MYLSLLKVASSAEDDPIERCMKCFCDFPISQLVKHSSKCEGEMLGPSTERFKEFLPSIHDVSYTEMFDSLKSVLKRTSTQINLNNNVHVQPKINIL